MVKVASYCRVSTDKEDQANSFEAQRRYFREYIQRHPDWQLHEVYADEGITGTSTRKRTQFNRMINDAYGGKFSLIITKEVSRFSRNILDTIAYTRQLKTLGVGVIFVSDGFSTLDPDAELRLSIMGSIAQEESRKTSARVKWGQTRQMERGVVFGGSMLGYDVRDGKMTLNQEGAAIVRSIFHKYAVEKKGTTVIARELREAGYRTRADNPVWSSAYIIKILKNEKYVGDLVQKKTITPDYLTHDKKYNHGEEELVILRDHHEPIISRQLWDAAQEEISRRSRRSSTGGHSNRYILSGKMKCGECGASFVSRVKTRKDGTSYRRWGCLTAAREGRKRTDAFGNELGCDVGKQIREDLALELLQFVVRSLPVDREQIIENVASAAVNVIRSGEGSDDQVAKLRQQIRRLLEKRTDALDAFLSGSITQEDLQRIQSRYDAQLETLQARLDRAAEAEREPGELVHARVREETDAIIFCRKVSEAFLKALLESMVIHRDGTVEVKLNQLPTVWRFQLEKQ